METEPTALYFRYLYKCFNRMIARKPENSRHKTFNSDSLENFYDNVETIIKEFYVEVDRMYNMNKI